MKSIIKRIFIISVLMFLSGRVIAQDWLSYQFYDQKGKKVEVDKMVKDLSDYDIVFFGENHNNSINHWLQLQLTEALYQQRGQQLILGAEMFERDNQTQLNDYLNGKLESKNLKDSARLWSNFFTDYKPLVDFAKTKKLKFIATNIPRKYASQVNKEGIESLKNLPDKDRSYIVKLPIKVTLETPGYQEMKAMMGDHAEGTKVMNFISAQAIKDATMAESILKNWNKGKLFLHYNGNFHSKEFGGIYWYIQQQNPKLKMAVISVFEDASSDLSLPTDNPILTQYNLVIPENMTKTY